MARALSVYEVLSEAKSLVEFDGKWQKAFGNPELSGSWIVWGQSSNGKTSFCMMLAKYLCKFGKVVYNSLEEGAGRTMQIALERANMREVARRFQILEAEPIEEMIIRLAKKKSANIVIIDSVQFMGLTYIDYKKLKRDFPRKLFIFISHAEGKLPEGRLANKIRYDANVKIYVSGYRAIVNSRFGDSNNPDNYITVWEEGAQKFYGEDINTENNENTNEQ